MTAHAPDLPRPPGQGSQADGSAPYPPPWGQPVLAPGWPPAPEAPASALPVHPAQYHEFFRAPRWRWWKPPAAALMALATWALVVMGVTVAAILYDLGAGNLTPDDLGSIEGFPVTPVFFLANNVGIAAAIPVAMWTQWAVLRQRPSWLSSVTGGLRWDWLRTAVLACLLLWIVITAVEWLVAPPEGLSVRESTWLLVVGILVTTPFQAAGEEYLIRGLLTRLVASYLPSRIAGLVVSALVSALVFAGLHLAQDPWLNAFYFCFGLIASWLVWRTGGLEAAIALHVVNNVAGEVLLPFTDISGIFDRTAGTGEASALIQVAVLVLAAWAMDWFARRTRLVRETAPGAPAMGG